jgi:hypothetical protein
MAAVIDRYTLQSTLESGGCLGYASANRRKGSKVQIAVATLGRLMTLHGTVADEQNPGHWVVERSVDWLPDFADGHGIMSASPRP